MRLGHVRHRRVRELPGLGIPDGNPPSGVASGYVWFDVMALVFAPRLLTAGQRTFTVVPRGYRATDFDVEPDASAAAYFFAAAAICGGRVRVPGLGRSSHQGDLRFVELLARMGATVEQTADATTVVGAAPLRFVQ